MENLKYMIDHEKDGVQTIHGYYDNLGEVNRKLAEIKEEGVRSELDDISVCRFDVNEMEAKYKTPLEKIDMNDVIDESDWIKYFSPKTRWEWDELVL